MKDSFDREIDYMRISITDRCNLRCSYCMPKDGITLLPMQDILTFEEIVRVCKDAVALGITKFKITGGEPLTRRGCADLVRMIKDIPGVEQVTMTTNGVLLKDSLQELMSSGLDAINISLDTLDNEEYKRITGFDNLDAVIESIQAALDAGMKIKINTVLQKGINENEWDSLLQLAKDDSIDVRFIEMMPIGRGAACEMVSNEDLLLQIKQKYGNVELDERVHGNGPAVYYRIEGFQGSVGLISAIHGKFCDSCNRIRMTATGEIKPCLCYGNSVDLRPVLRGETGEQGVGKSDGQEDKNASAVRQALQQAIFEKPQMHCFEEQWEVTEKRGMSKIGG